MNIKKKHWTVLFFTASFIVSFIESSGRSDFDIYKLAAIDLMKGINPYSHSFIDGYYYYYSLLFAYMIYPFTFLASQMSALLWLMLNSVLLYYIIIQIAIFLNISKLTHKTQFVFYTLLLLINLRFIRENYHSAQVTILILFLILYSLKYLYEEKHILSALLLALSINIKLLSLPILVYYLYRGYWKTSFYTIFFILLFLLIPAIWLPIHFYSDCMKQWLLLINPFDTKHLLDTEERSFHSITTLISTLFHKNTNDVYALPIRRYIVDLNIEQVKNLILIARIIFISSALLVIRSMPFNKVSNVFRLFFDFSYISALIPIIFPHQQHYAFILQMPATSVLIHYLITNQVSKLNWLIFMLVFFCFNLKIILGTFNEYYDHFKILTYGGLLVIFWLFYISFKVKFSQNNFSQLKH
ncbi:MAG: DUF2029 domain-containing protein [Bacteroidia bacterium]|nr:DUF2029 domain-containing protein [Bacteroidia bacterium]